MPLNRRSYAIEEIHGGRNFSKPEGNGAGTVVGSASAQGRFAHLKFAAAWLNVRFFRRAEAQDSVAPQRSNCCECAQHNFCWSALGSPQSFAAARTNVGSRNFGRSPHRVRTGKTRDKG